MKQSSEQMQRDFDKEASSWDENPGRVKLAADVAEAIKNHVPIRNDMDVLDFGCGTGLVTLHLQPLVGTITGMDSSQGMLGVLRDKAEKRGLKNVKTKFLDLEKGGVLEGCYHLIVSSMALHHVPETAELISKFHAILKPRGVLALADLDPDGGLFHEDNTGVFHQGFDRSELASIYRQASFENVQDWTAAQVVKPAPRGGTRNFTVFLMTGDKKGR